MQPDFDHIANLPKESKEAVRRAASASRKYVIWSDSPKIHNGDASGAADAGSIWSNETDLSAFWDHYVEFTADPP